MVTPEELRDELRPAVKEYAETVGEVAEEQEIYPKQTCIRPTKEGDTQIIGRVAKSSRVQ
jgi:hypothetical protein